MSYAAALGCLAVVPAALLLQNRTIFWNEDMLNKTVGLFILFVIVSASSIFLHVVYTLTLHPLAKYPGPLWARMTDWYSVYHCWLGDRHLDFYQLHCKYGSLVRYGPNRISVNTATALLDIYSVRANTQKAQFYSVFSYFFKVPMIVTTIDKKDHASKKRILSQALTAAAIKSMEDSILTNVRRFCQHLSDGKPSRGWNQPKNMTEWTAYVTSDIMGEITFARSWNTMESDENRHILRIISQGVAGLNLSGQMPAILKVKLDRLLFRKLINGVKDFQALCKAQSDWRLAHGHDTKKNDLFASLIEARDPETGDGITEEEIVAEAGSLLLAGSDTQATALTATIFYCLHYPATLLRLQREIRTVFDVVEDIRIGRQLSSCRYLRACLDEAMRLSPPIGGLLPREVLRGGLTVDGAYLPEGVNVGVPHYAIHHNEMYYPEPFLFKPERWIVNEPTTSLLRSSRPQPKLDVSEAAVALARSAFCAFGVGRTSCVGKLLAYQEMSIVLARIIWLYDIRLQAGSTAGEGRPSLGKHRARMNEFQTWDGFFSTHDGPMVEFRPRLLV